MPQKSLSINPYLSEYVYDLLWNYPLEDRKKISRKYWNLLTSSTRARNFADYSTLEQKMGLFAELGIEYAIIFTQEKLKNTTALKQAMKLYQADKIAGAVKELSKLKVFVSADREMSFLLSLMSQTIHQKGYFLNHQLNKLQFSLKNWPKDKISAEEKEFREIIEGCDSIDKTLLNCCINIDFVRSNIGVAPFDMRTLLYLNMYKHTYISKERVADYFSFYSKNKIGISLKRLFLNDFIKREFKGIEVKYALTVKGINAVSDFRKSVLKENNYD